jgi:hypothetical protein
VGTVGDASALQSLRIYKEHFLQTYYSGALLMEYHHIWIHVNHQWHHDGHPFGLEQVELHNIFCSLANLDLTVFFVVAQINWCGHFHVQ